MDDVFFYYSKVTESWDKFLQFVNVKGYVKTAFDHVVPDVLADLFAALEREEDTRVDCLITNAVVYSDFRKFGRDVIEPETKRENLLKGLMGMIWGANIFVCKNVPSKTIIALTEKDLNSAVVLQLDSNPEFKEVMDYYKQLKDVSKQIQSLLDKSACIIQHCYEDRKTLN